MTYTDIERVNSEIKTLSLGKKEYAEVAERVRAFRKLQPEGLIKTEMVKHEDGNVIFKAEVYGTFDGTPHILFATGYAHEKEGSSSINRTSAVENCETSAVGRALGFLGLTGGASIASYEEVANAKMQQEGALLASTVEKKGLVESARAKGLIVDDVLDIVGFDHDRQPEGLTREQYARAMEYISKCKQMR